MTLVVFCLTVLKLSPLTFAFFHGPPLNSVLLSSFQASSFTLPATWGAVKSNRQQLADESSLAAPRYGRSRSRRSRLQLRASSLDAAAANTPGGKIEKFPSKPEEIPAGLDKWKALKLVAPKELRFQIRTAFCFGLLVMTRAANTMIPLMYKATVDALGEVSKVGLNTAAGAIAFQTAVFSVSMYVAWKLTQGLGDAIRQYAWVKVLSDLRKRLSVEVLRHLHSLSLRFHVTSKSGETLQVIEKGTLGLERLLDVVPFRLFPAAVDVALVCGVLIVQGQSTIAAIAATSVLMYALATYIINKWRTKFWRGMVDAERVYKGKAVESLQNFETVKYFAADEHEIHRYKDLIGIWQRKQAISERSLFLINAVQQLIICGGIASVLLLSCQQVATGAMTPGDFVMVNAYMQQLYLPLSWLGTIYRMVEDSFVDAEKMMHLLEIGPEVRDKPGASDLKVSQGVVEFDQVGFTYNETSNEVLNNISFTVRPGQTLALVGSSGSGKSTIGRLLFRLYDVKRGSIKIDGVDIRDVTQGSVRSAIGVVPQETTLFNDELGYNIQYGSITRGEITAGQHDVEESAMLARLHERVLTFEDGYRTIVGEKGMRLSGGEKQRVGIARTFIKRPRIVLLDEATSALDSQTENEIQGALEKAVQGRTAIVIAHRLSTIVNADEICVLSGGKIVERGRHEDLLLMEGEYHRMWSRQSGRKRHKVVQAAKVES